MSQAAYRRILELLDKPPSPLQRVDWPAAIAAGVELYVKRDELLDPRISGNKWRKLLPQIAWELRQGATHFATVGGVHSNHIPAFAALMERLGSSHIQNIVEVDSKNVGALDKLGSSHIQNIVEVDSKNIGALDKLGSSHIQNIVEVASENIGASDMLGSSHIQNIVEVDSKNIGALDKLGSSHIQNIVDIEPKNSPNFTFVRGQLPSPLSSSLAFAKTCGIALHSATRQQVSAWRTTSPSAKELDGATWIPEGGTTKLALLGMAQCYREIKQQLGQTPDAVIVAAGSGGTAAGLARKANCPVYAMDVVGDKGLPSRIKELLSLEAFDRLHLLPAQLKGFASGESDILQTMLNFKGYTGIQLDPIYTAKALLKLDQLLWRGEFEAGSKIVLVHTGGLQGVAPWMDRYWPSEP